MLLLQIQALQMAFKRGRCITSWEKAFTNKHSPLVLGLVLTPASQQPDEPTKRKSSPATFCSTTVRRTAVITPREVRHENLNMGSYQHRQRRGKAVAAARGGAPVAAHGPNGGAVGSGGEEGEHHAQNVRMDACPRRGLPAPHVESWPILVVLGAFRRTHRLRTKRPGLAANHNRRRNSSGYTVQERQGLTGVVGAGIRGGHVPKRSAAPPMPVWLISDIMGAEVDEQELGLNGWKDVMFLGLMVMRP